MLPVPENMLNRRNAQLYQRLLALQSDLHEKRSAVRMEVGMIEDAKTRAAMANRSLVLLRKQQSDTMAASEKDREKLTAVSVEVERLTQSLTALNAQIGGGQKQTSLIALQVDDARAKLKAVEEEGQRLEETVAEWVRENRETAAAEETAQIVMSKIASAVKHRLEKCNAISAACHALQNDFEDERDAAMQLRHQVAAMKEQTQSNTIEVANLQSRIAELENVTVSLDEAIAIKAQIINTVAQQAEQMKQSRNEFRVRLEKEAQAVAVMERLDHESKGRKDGFSTKCREQELRCRDMEESAKSAERTVDATFLHKLKLENALQSQREELTNMTERLRDLERLRENVLYSEKKVSSELDSVKKADVSVSALQTVSAIRLHAAAERFERSKQHLRTMINKAQTAALGTNKLNEMIMRCQKRMLASVTELRAREEAVRLDEKVVEMADQVDKAAAQLAYAKGLNVDDPEVIRRRALLKERIAALEAEEEMVAKEHAERDRAVRGVSRRLSAETTAGNFLQADVQKAVGENKAVETENEAFYSELDELIHARQSRASMVESLWAKVNAAEQQLAASSATTAEAANVRIQMERDAAQRLAQIEADKATLQHMLNSQENDRHRTAMRLREMNDTIEMLTARYNAVVHLLQVRVAGGVDEVGAAAQITDAMSAEEMQARVMMQRTAQREELQSRGDALDQQICAVEREVFLLEKALGHAREHVMDFAALEAPPELDAAWQVVLRVESERRANEQAAELQEKIAQIEQRMQDADRHAQSEYQKYAAMAEALDAAREEHTVLTRELRTLQKSRHLTTVEHNRARVVSKRLAVSSASAVPANVKVQPQQTVVPRMPRAQALHQALSGALKKYSNE